MLPFLRITRSNSYLFSGKKYAPCRICLWLVVTLLFSSHLMAQIPKLISYQGVLTDNTGTALSDGSYDITVKIFDVSTGGTELWSEDHTVNLINGLFNIALGSNTALNLPFDKAYYVSTTVNNTELLPRSMMTASPYALNAPSNGGGNNNSGNPFALDNEDGTKSDVVFVDFMGQVGIGDHPGVFPEAFTYIAAQEPARVGLQTDLIYNPNTRMSVGVYGQASFGTIIEEDNDMAKGIQVNVLGENAFAQTGLYGLARDGEEGYGVIGFATDNDRSIGVFGQAYSSDNDIGILGITDGGENDVAVKGSNFGGGWAGYFEGKTYVGTNIPNANNENAQLYVDSRGNSQYGVLGVSNSIGAKFSGRDRGVLAEATSENGFSGQFLGRVSIQDAALDVDGPNSLSIFTTKNESGINSINNSNPAGDQETFGINAIATGLNSIGGNFFGSQVGGRFLGLTGIEASTLDEFAGVFYGDIKVVQKDKNLPETSRSTLRPSQLSLSERNPGFRNTTIDPARIRMTSDNALNPRLEFYYDGGNQSGSISMSATDMFFKENKRFIFQNSNGFLIQSNMAGRIDAPNAYGLQLSGSNQGIYVDLTGATNEDNAFIRFADADGVQGTIRGQTSVSDLAGALTSEVSTFINNLLSPTSFQNLTGSSQTTSSTIDPFSTTQNSSWSSSSNASSDLSSANGKTISMFASQTLTPEFLIEALQLSVDAVKNAITFGTSLASIFDLEDVFSKGYDFAMSTFNLISFLDFALVSTYGIAYETGSGDYAEWLIRADTAEIITRGDIVGVRAGEISKDFIEADHFMAISTAPAVIGKMPQPEAARFYEQTAFMGQVPVKVTGLVEKGDYILPSGKGDGLGIAIHPKQMRTLDYHRIVGIAWEESDGKDAFKFINVAVGINQNDLADIVHQMQNVMNEMQLAIQEVNPNYQPSIFATVHPGEVVRTPSFQNYTVASTHASQLSDLFDSRNYETKEEAIEAVKKAWNEVANIDLEEHPHMSYILENQDKMDEILQNYSHKLEEL